MKRSFSFEFSPLFRFERVYFARLRFYSKILKCFTGSSLLYFDKLAPFPVPLAASEKLLET